MTMSVLDDIRGLAAAGRVRFSSHMRNETMPKRRISPDDVVCSLMNASSCRPTGEPREDKYIAVGPDLDGDTLQVVVVVECDLFVVTAFT